MSETLAGHGVRRVPNLARPRRENRRMKIDEIVGWLNHSLALEWNDNIAQARDLLQKTGE